MKIFPCPQKKGAFLAQQDFQLPPRSSRLLSRCTKVGLSQMNSKIYAENQCPLVSDFHAA
jgi:hypothetical protein